MHDEGMDGPRSSGSVNFGLDRKQMFVFLSSRFERQVSGYEVRLQRALGVGWAYDYGFSSARSVDCNRLID